MFASAGKSPRNAATRFSVLAKLDCSWFALVGKSKDISEQDEIDEGGSLRPEMEWGGFLYGKEIGHARRQSLCYHERDPLLNLEVTGRTGFHLLYGLPGPLPGYGLLGRHLSNPHPLSSKPRREKSLQCK